MRRALLIADLSGLVCAYAASVLVAGNGDQGGDALGPLGEVIAFALTLPLWVIAAKLYRLYDRTEEQDYSRADDLLAVFNLVTVGTWLTFASARLSGLAHPDVGRVVLFWAGAVVFVALFRAAARARCRRLPSYQQNALIVGAGDVGQFVARKLLERREYGVNVLGFLDANPREREDRLGDLTVLGSPDELSDLVRTLDIDRVVFAFSNDRHEDLLPLLRQLSEFDVQIEIVPRFFDVIGPGVDMHSIHGLPVVGLRAFTLEPSAQLLKRVTDIVVSAVALAVLAPLFAVVALLIKLDSRGPVFFRQVRMGAGNRTFRICKFRTMVEDADERKQDVAHLNGHRRDPRMFKVPEDPRMTRIGRFLRRFSLDELPQLCNVLKGEMSLVGPRPLILEEDEHVWGWARKRLALRPGMTGLWQVLGAGEIPFEEMIKLDYRYVSGWSLKTDLELIVRTIPAVFRERHAY